MPEDASHSPETSRDAGARPLLIVSHGSPSAPEEQEEFLAGLAAQVAEAADGRPVLSATLAMPGALDAAVARALEAGPRPMVFPHFMTDGWFVSTELARRVREALAALDRDEDAVQALPPFGLDVDLPRLIGERACGAAAERGWAPEDVTLVMAAHGSPKAKRPGEVTRAVGAAAQEAGRLLALRCGFVDEAPSLEEALSVDGPAVCAPFFAIRAGHVTDDLPAALAAAGFDGPVLPPVGLDPDVPRMIAAAATRAAALTGGETPGTARD